MFQIEENIENSIGKITLENNNLSTKLFLAEQELSKKSTTISLLKKKIINSKNKFYKDEEEYYIIEPSEALIKLNDELYLYKEIYSKLISSLKKSQKSISKYEVMVSNLQNELIKIKNKYRLSILSANRDKENYLSILSQNTRNATTENSKKINSQNLPINNNYNTLNLFPSDNLKLKSKFNILEDKKFYANVHSLDEFGEILKSVGLTKIEFQKMTKLKTFCKLTDAIEMIFGFLVDKNSTIKILQNENENLTNKNFILNKENMTLTFEIKKLKNELNIKNNENDFETLSNNISQITINREKNFDALINYQKLLEKQKEDDELQKNIDELNLSCSSKMNNDTSDNYEEIIKRYIMESTSLKFDQLKKKINSSFFIYYFFYYLLFFFSFYFKKKILKKNHLIIIGK